MPIGGPELIVILIVALLIFGKRLPETMRNMGKSINEFKRGMNEVASDEKTEPEAA
jgi:sec-independent protein translocase protein TatA